MGCASESSSSAGARPEQATAGQSRAREGWEAREARKAARQREPCWLPPACASHTAATSQHSQGLATRLLLPWGLPPPHPPSRSFHSWRMAPLAPCTLDISQPVVLRGRRVGIESIVPSSSKKASTMWNGQRKGKWTKSAHSALPLSVTSDSQERWRRRRCRQRHADRGQEVPPPLINQTQGCHL